MSAPEPQPESKIVAMTPSAFAEGQRSLAAILFTDAVGFSALMSRDEDRARRLISRDLASMRAACVRFEGEIVKSTGDGLMMIFGSAVQAVSCAFEIQGTFRTQNSELPMSERLRHRIGIHLGDVVRQNDDVMGDGVNIASRLQGEATPGGVCVSATVYEVVKSRLAISVVNRKARKLKNVGTIVVYQISQRQAGYEYLHWAWNWILARKKKLSILLGVALAFWVADFFSSTPFRHYHDDLQEVASDLNPLGPVSTLAPTGGEDDGDDDDDDDSTSASSTHRLSAGAVPATDEDFFIARFNDMKVYNFVAMRTWLETHDTPNVDGPKVNRVLLSMQQLFDWCFAQLPAYSSAHPLVVRTEHEDLEVWAGPANEIILKVHGTSSTLPKEQLPPGVMAEIALQLLRDNATPKISSTRDLYRGLEYFLASYRILSERLRKQVDVGAR